MGTKKYISKNKLGLVLCNKKFSELTTMKVGGKIKLLYYPNTIENLTKVLEYLHKKKENYFVLGNGSNVIASDRPFKDIVISGKHLVKSIEFKEYYFICSAFMDLRIIVAKLVENHISTLTNLAGIPATLGGAIVSNCGAFKVNISDNLLWVKYLENGKVVKKEIDDINFGYRTSEFKRDNIVILEAAFKVIKDIETKFIYKNILEKRRLKHPLNFPNSGSIFKNTNDLKAYEIIKKINLDNYAVGGAKFSEIHSNFIVNYNNAKAKDIYELIILAKKRALILENINLEEEVILVNFPTYKLVLKYLKK